MADIKTKKILFYLTTVVICSFLLLSVNSVAQDKTLSFEETDALEAENELSLTIEEDQRQFGNTTTYDKKWNPPNYTPPPQDTILAIEKNLIVEYLPDAKGRPNRVLLTAVVNSGMLDYTLNWIESLKRTNQDEKFLVFAIDQGVVDELTARGYRDQVTLIPQDWLHVPLASDFAQWKTNDYRPITHAKSLVVERLLYLDVTVWFTDVDIVFLSPYIRDTMLLKMSERPNTHMLFSQEVDQRTINSGFYMMKPSIITKQFMSYVVQEQDKPNALTQQKVMNAALKLMFKRDLASGPYRLLDMLMFPNGKYYFRLNLPKRLGFEPLMIHANYLIGDKKKQALQKAGLWYDSL